MKLIRAPTAIKAKPRPITSNNTGLKLEICSFAFATRFVTKSVGNSIICDRVEGCTPLAHNSTPYFTVFIMKNRTWLAIAKARNTPITDATRGKNAVIE